MSSHDLEDLLDRDVYPALFSRLDSAFPEYGFCRKGNRWEATADATRSLPGSPRPDRVQCYSNRPWGLVIHGGSFVRLLDLVNGCTKPTGSDFPEAVRKLASLAGISVPERQVSPEEAERHAKRHARQSTLETVAALCRETLRADTGRSARAYLEDRGLDQAAQEELGLGLYPSVETLEQALFDAGHDVEAARGVLFAQMSRYVVFPWADASGQPMTLYGRWPATTPPLGKPKTLALPGGGTKASPLYFDRARRAGLKELVLVEGLIDAALLQAKGEAGVVACMGSQFSASQLETLERSGVRSVTLCLDPDGAGETGTLACIKGLYGKGIKAFVAPVLPEGKDPDEYVLANGLDAWRAHIGQKVHAFRYQARSIVKAAHKGEAWTDASLAACIDEAMEFDAAVKDPERLTDLSEFFWPEIQAATGADFDAINARREAARDKAESEKERRAYEELVRSAGDKLRDGNLDAVKELLREETDRLRTQERHWKAEPVRNVADELADHEARLEQWRGREFIGLPQKTLQTLDRLTLGLRGLMLLAAAPNVGKTTLAVQLGLDTVVHNKDAAFLFVSLEMSRWDMLTRFRSRLAGLDYNTLLFGSGLVGQPTFTQDEFKRLVTAQETLFDLGNRVRILDDKNFPAPTLEKILDQAEDLKASSGASRVFVLVDYLQVWPVPDALARTLRTDIDADKWRIGQMKELRDAIGSENPVLVISEARKPSSDQEWASDLAAVMGTARGTYTPDMVVLLNPLTNEELAELGGKKLDSKSSKEEVAEAGKKRREQDDQEGFNRLRLSIAKGRDGVQRGRVNLRFHFRQ